MHVRMLLQQAGVQPEQHQWEGGSGSCAGGGLSHGAVRCDQADMKCRQCFNEVVLD